MSSWTTSAALLCLLAGAAAAVQTPHTVFLDKEQASSLISRQKRTANGVEQICMEKLCTYEEARKIFQDSYRTDIFWAVYVDGDQCAENPCKNGAMCSDSVGGYDCVCKSGFTGVHCEDDQTLCPLEKDKGCSQFCKPGYTSYECSCARGWKLTDKTKCVPAVGFPCGQVSPRSRWEERLASNVRLNFQGLPCTTSECPWQALLKNIKSPSGYCSGVILKENLVLTSAQCANKYDSFQVVVGRRNAENSEVGENTLHVKLIHVHPRYVPDRPEFDVAVIELRDRIIFKREVSAACVPEKDFAESILMTGEHPAIVTGWKESSPGAAFQGPLTLNQLAYDRLPQCLKTHPNLMTNKMGCTTRRANADCTMSSGSPLLTLYRNVFFVTGVVSQPPGADCTNGYIFQKVSRYLGWLRPLMGSR